MTSHLQLLKHVLTFHNSFKSFGFLNVVFLKDTPSQFSLFFNICCNLSMSNTIFKRFIALFPFDSGHII